MKYGANLGIGLLLVLLFGVPLAPWLGAAAVVFLAAGAICLMLGSTTISNSFFTWSALLFSGTFLLPMLDAQVREALSTPRVQVGLVLVALIVIGAIAAQGYGKSQARNKPIRFPIGIRAPVLPPTQPTEASSPPTSTPATPPAITPPPAQTSPKYTADELGIFRRPPP